jgi:predicted LPLAT superfamily acyltransferase
MDAAQASQAYLERVQQQQRVHQTHPDLRHLLGYDPRWAELAAPNAADRVRQQRQANAPEAER